MTSEERFRRLEDISRSRGLRLTPQRVALLRALGQAADRHPTADELYRVVRRRMPSVSPATVYRNVRTLARAGVISRFERAGGPVQYDANLETHQHFVCRRCGRVADIYLAGLDYRLNRRRSPLSGARIESCEVQLGGVCARCRQAR